MPSPSTLYDVIAARRDVRREFTGGPVDPVVLDRILGAAHAAPSVGLSQPWDFVLVDDDDLRRRFHAHVLERRAAFAADLPAERSERFAGIKVEGILDAGLSIVVTHDPERGGAHVLGRHTLPETGLYSVCLAIQNLWLAATAEGWGVGWVSFYEEAVLTELLGLPAPVRPVAWLCVGPVSHLAAEPDLERHGWAQRRPLADVVHRNRWGRR